MNPEELANNILTIVNNPVSTILPKSQIEIITEIFQQAKSEWCKEQRENCVKKFAPLDEREKVIYNGILNAPEPE